MESIQPLITAGEKWRRPEELETAHNRFQTAYDDLRRQQLGATEFARALTDLLLQWTWIYYHRGDYDGWYKLLKCHLEVAEAVNDPQRLALYYAWLGFCLVGKDNASSGRYLDRALALCEDLPQREVLGFVCTWLTWNRADSGALEEACRIGEQAQALAKTIRTVPYIYYKSLCGLGCTYYMLGRADQVKKCGQRLLAHGRRHANPRSLCLGYMLSGIHRLMTGDNPRVIEWFHKALAAAPDPFHANISQTYLGMGLVLNDRFGEALDHLREVSFNCDICGNHWLGPITDILLGVVMVAEGKLSQGVKKLEKARKLFGKRQRGFYVAFADFIMGKIFLKMAERSESIGALKILANLRFLLQNAPFADLKAEDHLNRAIAGAKKIGAAGLLGQAYLDLALVHKSQKRYGQARKFLRKAIPHFKACEAKVFLKEARRELAGLGS